MSQLSEKERLIKQRLEELFYSDEISNNGLVSIMKLCEELLALKRVSTYAKQNKISTQGARKFRNTIKVCGYTLVIDND